MVGVVATSSTAEEAGPPRQKRFRALRHPVSEFGVGPLWASAWHPRLGTLTMLVDNVSLHGVGVRLQGGADSLPHLQVDDGLSAVHVTLVSGDVVFHGEARVRHARAEGNDCVAGLALIGGVIDLPLLHEHQTRTRFSARCDEAEREADTARILPEFKTWVADLRSYLETMQLFLDREEAGLASEDLFTRERVCAQYVAEIGPRIVQRVHEASHRMGTILGHLTEDNHVRHRGYAQQHLGALFNASPFIRRALHKPLGYAGDYEMMNMLYRPAEEGSTLFGKVVNLCAVREVAARANINRISFLAGWLRGAVEEHLSGGRALVASIGCGPAREIDQLLEVSPELGAHLDVMLVDQDPRAIAYCERKLTPRAERSGAKVHIVRESVRRLLTGGSLYNTLGPRDLIYSAGLFDYLSDRSFVTLLSALYDAVKPGGRLIIGNVSAENPTRYFMEYVAEWFLIHRSPPQLLDKARALRPTPRDVRVESEPLGVNLFLVVEK